MSNIGTLTPVRKGAHEELHGEINTLEIAMKVRFSPELSKSSDQAPDYKIFAISVRGQPTEIGAAWKKTKRQVGDTDMEFLSITIDDPSLPSALNVAAFKNMQGNWDITWRRRQTSQQPAA